jgi:CHASE1-domain containing sensor protein
MTEYLKFWAAKLIVENAIPLAVLLVIGLSYLVMLCVTWVKQARCQHMTFRETRACDAICLTCNKNLGFIGSLERRRKNER